MPDITVDGVTIHYQVTGSGETVAFVGEAGFGPWQWAWQYEAVAGPFQALIFDLRGTGNSDAPTVSYDIDTMAADLEGVLADVEARRVHLVGAGLGEMVCLRHAREYGRAASLSLFGTAQAGAAVDERELRALHPDTKTGQDAMRESLQGAFSEEFLAEDDLVDRICDWREREDADGESLEIHIDAMLDFEAGPLYEQELPALVGHGLDDPVVPVNEGRELASQLPNGTFVEIEGRHLCFAEHARAVNDRLLDFLDAHRR